MLVVQIVQFVLVLFCIFSFQCQYIYGDVSFNNDSLYHIYQYVDLCYFLIQLEDLAGHPDVYFFWSLYAAEFLKEVVLCSRFVCFLFLIKYLLLSSWTFLSCFLSPLEWDCRNEAG